MPKSDKYGEACVKVHKLYCYGVTANVVEIKKEEIFLNIAQCWERSSPTETVANNSVTNYTVKNKVCYQLIFLLFTEKFGEHNDKRNFEQHYRRKNSLNA